MNIKTYTHTEEGKDVLNLLEHVICTSGMEVYKCIVCDELFGSQHPDDVCGICMVEVNAENRDSHGLENLCEEDE